MMTFDNFIHSAHDFLNKLFTEIHHHNFEVSNWEIDHLCYRTSSLNHYQQKVNEINKFGTMISKAQVNGREITTIKLHKPIRYNNYNIYLIEIPAPKKDKVTDDGFEHIEFVIDCKFEKIMDTYKNMNTPKAKKSGLESHQVKI